MRIIQDRTVCDVLVLQIKIVQYVMRPMNYVWDASVCIIPKLKREEMCLKVCSYCAVKLFPPDYTTGIQHWRKKISGGSNTQPFYQHQAGYHGAPFKTRIALLLERAQHFSSHKGSEKVQGVPIKKTYPNSAPFLGVL